VTDPATTTSELKKNWLLTESSFRQLLNWLDEAVDSGGEKYLEMRRRLVAYFDRKNCNSPDELADETLNRVARRLEEEGSIDSSSPAHYCYIVAKFVFLEYLRRTERSSLGIDEVSPPSNPTLSPPAILEQRNEVENEEKRLNCLEQCLKDLELQNRELIIRYYQGDQRAKIENRRAIAVAAGITMNALGIRVCRIRNKLEACVCKCLDL
jgi:DNA-directed RNA polymerase specialized sigma24 family protein